MSVIGAIAPLQAATLASWDFDNISTAPPNKSFQATTLGAEDGLSTESATLSLSPSVTATGTGNTPAILGETYGFAVASGTSMLSEAMTQGDYLEFSINAASNSTFSLSRINYGIRLDGDGPGSFTFLSSTDGFASSTTQATTFDGQDLSGSSIPSGTNVTGVEDVDSVTFRVYGYNSDGGSLSLFDRGAADGLEVVGNFNAVPEPSVALTSLLGCSLLFFPRRRASRKKLA